MSLCCDIMYCYHNCLFYDIMCLCYDIMCCCLQKVQERWYESLHDWEAAYKAYQERQKQRPDDISLTLGKMRCLHAMGEW